MVGLARKKEKKKLSKMSNKAVGNKSEAGFANLLSGQGFWVHRFQDNQNGQPCDVIAARSGHTYLFDCKDCQGEQFLLRRMEENQYNAMKLFELSGNSRGMFAIRFRAPEETYLVEYWQLAVLRDRGIKRIGRLDCRMYGRELWSWIRNKNQTDRWCETDGNLHRK